MIIRFWDYANKEYFPDEPAHFAFFLGKKSVYISADFDSETVISLTEARRLMAFYGEMLKAVVEKEKREAIKGSFGFILKGGVTDFDLSFIAALNLIKFSFPNIALRLFFEKLEKNTDQETCFFRFGQFAVAGYLSYGKEVFGIYVNKNPVDINYFMKNLSGYLPFVSVRSENFNKLFLKPIRENWRAWWKNLDSAALDKIVEKSNRAEELYQELRQQVIRRLKPEEKKGDPIDWTDSNNQNFHVLYVFSAARDVLFIKKLLRNEVEILKGAGAWNGVIEAASGLGMGISREEDARYEERVESLFKQLLEKPPFFIMLFAYFIESFYKFTKEAGASHAEKIDRNVELIINIFVFTEEMFYGLRELAKNIIEHSSNRRGVVMGRILNRDRLPSLKPQVYLQEYLESRPGKEEEFVDFMVLDDGMIGIVQQTIINLEVLNREFSALNDEESTKAISKFNDDIARLSSGEIVLDDFFNPQDLKLKYQEIRSALSLGLLIFSSLVLENSGYLLVSSPKGNDVEGMVLFENWEKRYKLDNLVPLGAFYNIVFPKNTSRAPVHRSESIPYESLSGESAFKTLIHQLIVCPGRVSKADTSAYNSKDSPRMCFVQYRFEPKMEKEATVNDNIDLIIKGFNPCEACDYRKKGKILGLDLKEVDNFDYSDLFRTLARIQQTKDIKSIIVYNVREEIVKRLINIFEIFRKMKRSIGSNDHFVLFYYNPEDAPNKYYSFLLAGESLEDMYWINDRISQSNYTLKMAFWSESYEKSPSPEFRSQFHLNSLFSKEGHLLPFDVLIKSSNLSLFERNELANLQTAGMHATSPSYMFKDAHMRLGSKIHLTDFYYARRIFQNSFYSLRFAYLVCEYIRDCRETQEEWKFNPEDKNNRITILGYGIYSELLISNIDMLLKTIYPTLNLNHAVINDTEKMEIHGKVFENIIVVIPISSTLSTSKKIAAHIDTSFRESKIIGIPINILIVGNRTIKEIIEKNGDAVTDPVAGQFWKQIDKAKKIITTLKPERKEKYFLYLSTIWNNPQTCPYCFPENPTDEKVLFEVDKVSVTPFLIYDLPAPKKQKKAGALLVFGKRPPGSDLSNTVLLSREMLLYGHIARGSNHYLYYIETKIFLQENRTAVINWLNNVKSQLMKIADISDSKIVLIAPTHLTNADFINLVNEVVFNDMATLFHYDQDDDYIQNLRSFFSRDISDNAYVFFIDDAMCSGGSFDKINSFIKYARMGKISRGADGAIVLLNRLMQDKYSVLSREVDNAGFHAFVDLEAPIMVDSSSFCHLCIEQKKYKKMLEESLLDSVRLLIRANIEKLNARKYDDIVNNNSDLSDIQDTKFIDRSKRIFTNRENYDNYLDRMEFIHRLFLAFGADGRSEEMKGFFNENKSLEELCKKAGYGKILDPDGRVNLIKILSNPYFVYHKSIKQYIFRIILLEFSKTLEKLEEIAARDLIKDDLNTFRYMKFLIKRCAALRANYLIRQETIIRVFKLYRILNQKQKVQSETPPVSLYVMDQPGKNKFSVYLQEFIDYYVMAVKEVTWFNDAASLKLEETLNYFQRQDLAQEPELSKLIQFLKIENSPIPCGFLKMLLKKMTEKNLNLHFTENDFEADTEIVWEQIKKYDEDDPYRAAPLYSYLVVNLYSNLPNHPDVDSSMNWDAVLSNENDGLVKFPLIALTQAFLLKKIKSNEAAPQTKPDMDYLLFCLCKVLGIDINFGGGLFAVRYVMSEQSKERTHLFPIGNIGKEKIEDERFFGDDSFIQTFFLGYPIPGHRMPVTFIQFIKKEEQFTTNYGFSIPLDDVPELASLEGMRRFVLIRVADDDINSTAKGIIAFYDNRDEWVRIENLRDVLILKKDIFHFIEKNYENFSLNLYNERKRQINELEVLNGVIEKITSSEDLDDVVKAVSDIKGKVPMIDEVCLIVQKGETHVHYIKCGESGDEKCEECNKRRKLIFKEQKTYSPVYIPNVNSDNSICSDGSCEINTRLVIPLNFDSKLLGIFEVRCREKDALPSFERKLLSSLASQIAIAINNWNKQQKQLEIYMDITHSLGSYLTTLRGYGQRLVEGKVKDDTKKEHILNAMFGDFLALCNSVDEISNLSRMEYGEVMNASESVEIGRLIDELTRKNEFLLKEKSLNLIIKPDLESLSPVWIKADRNKLEEAFQSLLSNAIKFTDKNKNIEIEIVKTDNRVEITFRDEGYGIDAEDLNKIFDRYERGRIAKEKKIIGTGIGLAVAKGIIKLHGGEIRVESTPGKGSIFTIQLPVAEEKRTEQK